jgi:methylenetetrahydrofolate reductase (NADPH)
MFEMTELTEQQRDGIRQLLEDPIFELIPLKNVMEQAAHLPKGARVSVTASPTKTLEDTIELAGELAAMGMRAIPHISARMTKDRHHLARLVDRMDQIGLESVFVIGGDAEFDGEFYDAETLLVAMESIGHPFTEIGIGSYPEGHHVFDDATAVAALAAKQVFASTMTTQMCFSGEAIASWTAEMRAAGIHLPIVLGIPGVADRLKLMRIATRIGVGQSARFLAHNKSLLRTFVQPGGYSPDELLESMADTIIDERAGIVGTHIYTFNQVETTERWRREYLDTL